MKRQLTSAEVCEEPSKEELDPKHRSKKKPKVNGDSQDIVVSDSQVDEVNSKYDHNVALKSVFQTATEQALKRVDVCYKDV